MPGANRMKKFGYVCITIVVAAGALLFWMNTLVPKMLEKVWDCEILNIRQKFKLTSAEVELNDLKIQSLSQNGLAWELDIGKTDFQIEYASLFRQPLVLNRLVLDRLRLSLKTGNVPVQKKESLTQSPPEKQIKKDFFSEKRRQMQKGILIKQLTIKAGYLELSDTDSSGRTNRVKFENVNLKRDNVFLGNRPDMFFRDLLKDRATVKF